jgi:hypothetical protein
MQVNEYICYSRLNVKVARLIYMHVVTVQYLRSPPKCYHVRRNRSLGPTLGGLGDADDRLRASLIGPIDSHSLHDSTKWYSR